MFENYSKRIIRIWEVIKPAIEAIEAIDAIDAIIK